MIRAVLFDFDGLMLDTEYPEYLAWREVFAAHDCVLAPETWVLHTGKGATLNSFSPYEALEQNLGRTIDRDAIRTSRRQRFAELMEAEALLPGVEARMQEARLFGMRIAIVSSSPREWIEKHLSRFGLIGAFDAILSADDVTNTKPDPELYLAALTKLGVRAEQAMVFEDSPNGIASAKDAGLYCVAVPNRLTNLCNLDRADLVVQSLSAITIRVLLLLV